MELGQWIGEDFDRWFALCKAHGKSLSHEQVRELFQQAHTLYKQADEAFIAVLYLLMTHYGEDCAFLLDERARPGKR